MTALKIGDTVEGMVRGPVEISEELGSGGQGTVYRGRSSSGDVAVKWYHAASQTTQRRQSISELVQRPSPASVFLWPHDLVTSGDAFGYVMDLRPGTFANIPSLLRRSTSVRFSELILVALRTVSGFRALQAEGLFYCDISDGNLFFQPETGDILICDNDNVGSAKAAPGILGTPRYMAPEVVRGESAPSPLTDVFSMGVLLFLLMCNDHPLCGKREAAIKSMDPAAMKQLFGTNPIFIFDPSDDSNRPVPGVHINAQIFWDLYPKQVQDVFVRLFTAGLGEPGARPSFSEWQQALSVTLDSIVMCGCGKQTFVRDDGHARCWASCGAGPLTPLRLTIGTRSIVVRDDLRLYDHHLRSRVADTGQRGGPLAEVAINPSNGQRGLRNLTETQWWTTNPEGETVPVPPQRAVSLRPGTRVNFGDLDGVVG